MGSMKEKKAKNLYECTSNMNENGYAFLNLYLKKIKASLETT